MRARQPSVVPALALALAIFTTHFCVAYAGGEAATQQEVDADDGEQVSHTDGERVADLLGEGAEEQLRWARESLWGGSEATPVSKGEGTSVCESPSGRSNQPASGAPPQMDLALTTLFGGGGGAFLLGGNAARTSSIDNGVDSPGCSVRFACFICSGSGIFDFSFS